MTNVPLPKVPKIAAIDDEPANLQLINDILKAEYRMVFARSGEDGIGVIQKHKPDLVLLDVMMPKMDGFEVMRRLRANPETAQIPVIFVTARGDQEGEEEGLVAGAVDYVTKPVRPRILKARVRTHLALADQKESYRRQVHEATGKLEKSYHEAISMLGAAGHYNDTDTGVHIWRMAAYSGALARAALWNVEDSATLELAATMHDMGKIGIPHSILRKPGKLDAEEWEIMKRHAELGYDILSKGSSPVFVLAADIARHHHERWDGTGYPHGLSGNDIPEAARIVAIADVFDAWTMDRPYKKAWPIDESFDALRESAGTHLDPRLVELFIGIRDEIVFLKECWEEKAAA